MTANLEMDAEQIRIPKIPAVTVLFSAKAMLLRHCMQCCHIMDIFRRRN